MFNIYSWSRQGYTGQYNQLPWFYDSYVNISDPTNFANGGISGAGVFHNGYFVGIMTDEFPGGAAYVPYHPLQPYIP
jgi:hypothetical protein